MWPQCSLGGRADVWHSYLPPNSPASLLPCFSIFFVPFWVAFFTCGQAEVPCPVHIVDTVRGMCQVHHCCRWLSCSQPGGNP